MSGFWRWEGGRLHLRLHVSPGASRNSLGKVHGDRLKVHVNAPAEDGRATQAVLEVVAIACGVAVGEVELVSGPRSRQKEVAVRQPERLPEGVAAPADSRSPSAGMTGSGGGI